jgi:uncharacterized membrane protein
MDHGAERGVLATWLAPRDAMAWARWYRWVGGLALLLTAVLTPPFQAPDEPQHFYRSYQLSRLELRPEVREGKAGAMLPSSIRELVQSSLGTLVHHTDKRRAVPQRPLSQTFAALPAPLAPQAEEFVEFSGSALYAPLAYAPQAAAIAIGRQLDWSPLALLLAARVFNAMAAFALIGWAVARLSGASAVAVALASLPMTMFMLASASPDALTIAGGFVVAALVARVVAEGRWRRRDLAPWVLGGLLLCTVKVVYFPLLFAGLAALMMGQGTPTRQRRLGAGSQVMGALLVMGVTALWFWWRPAGVHGGGAPAGVDAAAQLALLRESPILLLKLVPRTLYVEFGFLADSFIGRLGWLNVPLPGWLHACAVVALAAGLWLRPRGAASTPRLAGAVWIFVLAYVVVELIFVAHYLAWTPVGNYAAHGAQGRYFLPLAPMVALALTWCLPPPPVSAAERTLRGLLLLTTLALPLGTLGTIARAYSL